MDLLEKRTKNHSLRIYATAPGGNRYCTWYQIKLSRLSDKYLGFLRIHFLFRKETREQEKRNRNYASDDSMYYWGLTRAVVRYYIRERVE
jgi:hypothetical protein